MLSRIIIVLFCFQAIACSSISQRELDLDKPCSVVSVEIIEHKFPTSDDQGHGPDVGSFEWYLVVERKLRIEGDTLTPKKETQAWCDYVLSKASDYK